jgi:hypothetical protein
MSGGGDEFGRIHIEPAHRVVAETVRARVYADYDHREAVDVKCDDFDRVTFYICVAPEQKEVMRVSLFAPCYATIESAVGEAYFRDLYAEVGAVLEPAQPGYSLTVAVNLDAFLTASDEQRGERARSPSHTTEPPPLSHPPPLAAAACCCCPRPGDLSRFACSHHRPCLPLLRAQTRWCYDWRR